MGGELGARSIEELLASIRQEMRVAEGAQIVHLAEIPAREGSFAIPTPPLPDALQDVLSVLGISQLYSHQVESLERVRRGENIVVVTATSSGKTLCYNLPILEAMLTDREARALYLYPINALVNDQLKGLFKMNLLLGKRAVSIAKYTGAVNSRQRRAARLRQPNIVLTNPEMLHLSFLLWHTQWEPLWRNLRYIVVDEVHTYRGVFGSNMAHLFRRVLRMAHYYGASPQFICCSATIANPGELVEALTGLDFAVIDRDGADRGRRFFVLWNPPLQGEEAANLRRSYAEESVDLLRICIRANYNTIVFARSRHLTERMLRLSRSLDEGGGKEVAEWIGSYRAGYLAEEREEIENRLKMGELRGIITTNALEMGIDIGGLDCAIISGYPGTIMSTWQQAGRVGRRGRDALVVMVASQNPLDQYYVRHPKAFLSKPHELAVIDLENQHIRLKHLLCAIRELPFSMAACDRFLGVDEDTLQALQRCGLLAPFSVDGGNALTYPEERRAIHTLVSLRSASHATYRILDEADQEIGTIEPPNVYRETHPGAIYQHGGDDYRVVFLDRGRRIVRVRPETAPHYTRASSSLRVRIETRSATRRLLLGMPVEASLGNILVEETVHSYQELELGSDNIVRRVNLTYPLVMRLHTTAMWLQLPTEVAHALGNGAGARQEESDEAATWPPLAQGLHAIQHLITGTMPLLVMCDRRDVDGYHHVSHPDVGGMALFVYDAYQGGIGLAEIAYWRAEELLRLAHATVMDCPCVMGCPSCIQSGVCRWRNEGLDKAIARSILRALIGESLQDMGPTPSLQGAYVGRPHDHALSRQLALQELAERTARRNLLERVPQRPSEARAPTECQWAKGDRLRHMTYGQGIVIASCIRDGSEWVTVRFMRRGMIREFDANKTRLIRL